MNPHPHDHRGQDFDWAAMAGFAELDAEVLISLLAQATSSLDGLCTEHGVHVSRILDIGSGPGVATCVLAERFESATVLAADGSPEMLANVEARAARLGLADRVSTRTVELPDGLDDLDRADLVWASLVLHHVGDEGATLGKLRALLEPGGLLALVEFGDPSRFIPDDPDPERPGVWDRLDAARAAWLADMRAALPGAVVSTDYPTMIEAAGLELLVDRLVTADVGPPLDARARQLAAEHVKRLREHVMPYAEPGDIAVLDALVDDEDPSGIMRRVDALIHSSRRLFVVRATEVP